MADTEETLHDLFGGDLWRSHPGPSGTDLYARYTRTAAGRLVLSGLVLLGDVVTTDVMRKVPVVELENSVNLSRDDVTKEVRQLPTLERTPGMSPEQISELVAQHYKTWARGVPHPAAAMAAEYGVKVPTIHAWIREARLRGYLPPAQRGKRGNL
jgi:hypothetical protein